MNFIDLVALIILIVTFLAGMRSGLLPQAGGLLGAVLGGFVAVQLLPVVRPTLDHIDPSIRALIVLGGLLLLVAVGEAAGSQLGIAARTRIGGVIGRMDTIAGAALGLGQGVLVIWLAGGLLAAGPLPSLAMQAQRSAAVRTLDRVLPPPTQIAGELARLLDASGLPEVFVGLEPFPAPAPDLPDDPTARDIADTAIPSTVEVLSVACSYQLTGSGFVVRDDYVVTNAHVVAGSRTVRIRAHEASFQDALVVLFDADLDIALLYAPALDAPALPFHDGDPETGDIGAAIGFPNGGPLTVTPGAVATVIPEAWGRNLYGNDTVTRRVIELRASIHRGNSGGPFVLEDGTVGGVVFAQARSDPGVAYALSPVSVADTIGPALDQTDEVTTGACVR
ncbi:MAG: MarP family serine protease [Chloroflexi bacterium]|nr:MarP family serine protease [Chloroflexota bacterium]